jgi:lipopolysaccharide heptosyltransferase II
LSVSARESILVYAPSWIGDAVMSLGAIRVLRNVRPDARISVLARPWVSDLYQAVEAVDVALPYDPRGADRGLRSLVEAARRARSERFDVCLLLPNAFRAAALARIAGIPERWGYATESRGWLLTRRVPPAPRPFGRHQAYYYLELMRGLGFETGEPDLGLRLPQAMGVAARELLRAAGWDGRSRLVGVHPGATNSRSKMWKPSRFADAAGAIAAATGACVVVLGGPSDGPLAAEVAERLDPPPVRLEGRTSLVELMGVIAELAVFLCNDSGPMHLAAALGTPTLAVFGPTDPTETGPFRAKARVVRQVVDCSPCLYRDCPIDHRCMERISVERVVEEAGGLLAGSLALTGKMTGTASS